MYEFKYRQLEEVENSGVEWVDKIPKDWKIIKNGILFYLGRGRVISKEEIGDSKGEYPVYSSQTANNGVLGYLPTYDFDGNYITWTTDGANAGTVFIRKGKFNCTNVCGTLKSKFDIDLSFATYMLSKVTKRYVRIDINPKLMNNQMNEIRILYPTIEEQRKIANFLDIKATQFDSIISKKKLLIQELEEAKKSLITEVVTGKVKIVDGEMVKRQPEEMKASGVEWLGMIPKEWVVKRIKNLFSLRNERNHKSMDEVQILSLYTALGVKKQEEIENKTGNVVRTVLDYKIVHPKDIVVNIILAWMGAIGVSKDKGVISPAYDIYKPYDNINSDYYSYLFRTSKFAGECFKYGRGIMLMRWRTYSDQFMSIYCCCPNKIEQDQIAEFIDRKIRDIDTVVEKNKLQIKKLKEAKQSLISEAVTGKIDLRDWEIIEEGDCNDNDNNSRCPKRKILSSSD